VRNPSAVPVHGVRPHLSAPRSHLGEELPVAAVTFDPPAFDPLPPRSVCCVELHVDVPAGTAPGRYLTVVLLSRLPHVAQPLHVDVLDPDTGQDR
jgi:hypothetical protein